MIWIWYIKGFCYSGTLLWSRAGTLVLCVSTNWVRDDTRTVLLGIRYVCNSNYTMGWVVACFLQRLWQQGNLDALQCAAVNNPNWYYHTHPKGCVTSPPPPLLPLCASRQLPVFPVSPAPRPEDLSPHVPLQGKNQLLPAGNQRHWSHTPKKQLARNSYKQEGSDYWSHLVEMVTEMQHLLLRRPLNPKMSTNETEVWPLFRLQKAIHQNHPHSHYHDGSF